MPNQHSKAQIKVNKLFNQICQLAKTQDKEGLTKIIQSGVCINIRKAEYISPITLLAKEGDQKAVDFLIDEFKASRNQAALGYAWGGYVDEVNRQILNSASRDYAAMGFAMAGNVERVNDQIKKGAWVNAAIYGYAYRGDYKQVDLLIVDATNRNYAVRGFARGGHRELVNELLAKGGSVNEAVYGYAMTGYFKQVDELIAAGANIDSAVEGYAYGNHTAMVDLLIAKGASRICALEGYARGGYIDEVNKNIKNICDRNYAAWGYASNGHIDQVNEQIEAGANPLHASCGYSAGGYLDNEENVLFLVTVSEDKTFQKYLLAEAKKKNNLLDTERIAKQATLLNRIMTEYQLTYKQAKSLSIEGARVWLLQGPELVREGRLPPEIFCHITSFLADLSIRDTEQVISAINKNLFNGAQRIIQNKFKDGFFSPNKRKEEHEKTSEHYLKRMKF